MQLNLHFDPSNKVEIPTFILSYKNGERIGQLTNIYNIKLADSMSEAPSFSFNIDKYNNGVITPYWDKLTTFKLVYCEEYNTWFEATVEYSDSTEVTKQITLTRLGEAELQMINVYGLEVNTDNDIDRDDYVITKLYNSNPDGSLLHRILSFAPHYSIAHVDNTVKDIQREFSFNETSVYEALQQVAEEENLYINYNSSLSSSNKIQRSISVYDLFSNCHSCGHRGNFTKVCPECGSTDIIEGYGHNTTICVTREDLGEDITISDNVDQIRNCYHVAGGDDYITDTVRNCNLCGSKSYLWNFTDEMKADMSPELQARIATYETLYRQYMSDQAIDLTNYVTLEDGSVKSIDIASYNTIIRKYQSMARSLYDTEIFQLQNIYDADVLERQAAYPNPNYIGNVDINHRPVIYNEDGSYSVGNSDYMTFDDGNNSVFYYFTGIKANGTVLTENEIRNYLNSFRTGDPVADMASDNLEYQILYKVEVVLKSNYDDACVTANNYITNIESTYRDIYDKEGRALCKLRKAQAEKAGVGDPNSSTSSLLEIGEIVGFPALINAWYNAYDVYYYLHDSLMPIPSMYNLTAQTVCASLTAAAISPVAVVDTSLLSLEIAQNAVLNCAKVVADSAFKVELAQSSLSNTTWSGKFKVTSLYDEEDVAVSASTISITITSNYANYVHDRLETKLYNASKNNKNIINMLDLNETNFKNELKKYSLTELTNIRQCFEGCVSVLSGLGAEKSSHAAHAQYEAMRQKVAWAEAESVVRENECNIVEQIIGTVAKKNSTANPFGLFNVKYDIQKYLDLETFFGPILWTEVNAFRREEAYSDSNYISDGLENGELIRRSYELLQSAEQKMMENNLHSYEISATLKNLLLIPEFEPLKEFLDCGNWIRIKTDDGRLYKLRLTTYEFDFSNPATLSVTFSDITDTSNIRSMQSLIRKMDYITRNTSQINVSSKFEYLNETISSTVDSTRSSINDMNGVINDISDNLNVSVTDMGAKISNKVSYGEISSSISLETGKITLSSNRLIVHSSNFQLEENGNATFSGTVSGATITGGTINGTRITGVNISGSVITSTNGSNTLEISNSGWNIMGSSAAINCYISSGGGAALTLSDGVSSHTVSLSPNNISIGSYSVLTTGSTVSPSQIGTYTRDNKITCASYAQLIFHSNYSGRDVTLNEILDACGLQPVG